jgi:molybdate transport repressor ModE-like protein
MFKHAAMPQTNYAVSIKPQWTITTPNNGPTSEKVLDLLTHVAQNGSLAAACKAMGISYRHTWSLLRQAEAQLGAPLLTMARGKGSTLSPLAEKLVWAGHRIHARLTPMLETLASELEGEIGRTFSLESTALRVHASHGFAVEKLLQSLIQQGAGIDRKYVGSLEAVASLHAGSCDLAGFHIPQGAFEAQAYAHYAKWFSAKDNRIIHVATRRQGLFVAKGNPKKLYHVADLARKGIRFINRQPSSGTRFLLECFLKQETVQHDAIAGFEQAEFTHAAVAAYVASGMADAGFGVETPAQRFNLDFIPLCSERYFLLCKQADLARPALQAVLAILGSDAFQSAVNGLAGYTAEKCGQVETLQKAFAFRK